MKGFKSTLLISGAVLCVVSLLLLIALSVFPTSYFIIALGQSFVLPFLWGIICILLYLLLRKGKKNKTENFSKILYFIVFLLALKASFSFTIIDAVIDIQAVLTGDLYVVEGKVIDTHIERSSSGPATGTFTDPNYFQHITLDNEGNDNFYIQVENMYDYVLQIGKTYKIISLPNSRTVLNYEEQSTTPTKSKIWKGLVTAQ